MYKICSVIVGLILLLAIESCGKKTIPTRTEVNTVTTYDTLQIIKKYDSVVAIKPVIKKKTKVSVPQVMVVNDKYAKRSIDGRLYYDLQGHRYWRSNKDGKYYLFNKSMLTDDAFKKPR